MPELPEVETMRRGILGIVGGKITSVERTPCPRKPILVQPRIDHFQRRVQDQRVREVGRVGKRVVLWLDSDDAIVIEPRMTGLVLVADPPTKEHLRVRFTFTDTSIGQVLYWDRRGLGSVRLFTREQFGQAFGPAKLGPDALAVTADTLSGALGTGALGKSRRAVKVALLDQRAVAGIGNLYASEILHLCGIHPARQCHKLTLAQWKAIADSTREVLQEAIRYEGSTLSDGTYRNALNKQGGYQSQHRVYDRAGQPCNSCRRGEIVRIVQAQRATFFCPKCQRQTGIRTTNH